MNAAIGGEKIRAVSAPPETFGAVEQKVDHAG